MVISLEQPVLTAQELTSSMLRQLNIAIHRIGYRQLCIAIPRFAKDETQSLCKELYPYVAEYWGCADWRAVEHSIRVVILDAWESRDPEVWEKYFPDSRKPPSNKRFIATLAELLH